VNKIQQNVKIWLEGMKITLKLQYIYVAGERLRALIAHIFVSEQTLGRYAVLCNPI
jgi:hypothetical protein